MLLQIASHYTSLPNPFEMKMSEIRFFYEGCRKTLKTLTKPKPNSR